MNTKMLARLHGSITALITPFTYSRVDYDAFAHLVDWQISQGTHGIVVAGTTGEHESLGMDELTSLFQAAVVTARGRIPVIAGCGDSSIERAVEIAKLAEYVNADATLHVGGQEATRDAGTDADAVQKALCRHFAAIHDATDIPIVMYNNPGRTGIHMHPDTISEISQTLPRVVGIKDCDSAPGRVEGLKQHIRRDDFSLLTGEDMHTLDNLREGGHGCISVTANVAPKMCATLQNAWILGDRGLSGAMNNTLAPVHEAMFLRGTKNPQGVKYALSLLRPDVENNFRGDSLRPISSDHEQVVRVALRNAGIWQPARATV